MVIATIIGVVAAGGVMSFSFMGAAAGWVSVGLSILTKVVLGAALRALMPKPSSGANRGYETTAIGTALDHQVIYGKVRVGGARIYDETTGTNNSYLHRIIAVAGHEVESFDKIYINDSYVNYSDIDASGNISSVVDPDGTTSTRYNDHVRIKFHLGSPTQSADATLVSESAHWTSAHKLSGIAYMYIRMKFDADVFPNGIPDFTAEVKGKKVYDPRTSTTVWSDNPALCVRDYLTASYGISEAVANIDDTLVTSAANVSDQLVGSPATKIYAGGVYKIKTVGSTNFTLVGAANNNVGTVFTATGVAVGTGVVETERYTCNGAFTTNSTPYEMIEALLTSMDGSIWYAQGKWRMKPAYWTAPVLDLDEDDLRSSLSVSTRHSRASNFNTVKGTFRGSESNWQTTDYPQVPENTASNPNPFLAVDNGQESVADVDLTFTDNSVEARRIARITLERNRQQLTVSGYFGLNTLQLQVGDNIRLTNSRFGWTNKEFEVVAWNFGLQDDLDLQVQMTLRETSESVYDEVADSVVYERDNTTLASPFATAEPQSLSSAATAFVNDDGTTVPSITFNWSVANPSLAELFEFEWKLTTDTNYNSTVLKETSWTLAPAESSKSYDYRVRSVNPLGVRSVLKYSTTAAATVDDATIPNAPSGLNVSGGYAATTVEWVAPTANTDASAIKDLFQYEVYRGTSTNPTTLVGLVAGTTFSDIGLANSTTYHYRVKALDFTGNKSAFSSNGSATTNPALTNGTDGSSVLVVYATNTSGSSQSLTAGSREYVQYYEYTGTTPSLPVSGTFIKFVGADGGNGNSIFPIYATSSAGASQSFNPSGKTFVTFFESATTPSLPVSGQTFVAYVGEDGTDGTPGATGAQGPTGLIDNPYGALAAYSNGAQSTITWDSTEQAMKLQSSADTTIGAAFPAFRVNLTANETHKLSVKYKSNGSYSSGFYARVYEYNAALPNGKLAVSNSASNSLVQEDTSGKTNWRENVSVSTTWVTSDYTYTPTAGAVWASIVVLNWTGIGNQPLFIRDPENQLIGSSGPQGIQGNAGTDGTNGSNGTNGTNGTDGTDGTDGDIFKTIYLYDAKATLPAAISITNGFTPSTGNAASTGTWTTTVPSVGSGQVMWLASMVVKQTAGTGNYVGQGAGWVRIQAQGYAGTDGTNGTNGTNGSNGTDGTDGTNGSNGSDAPRFASRTLYTNPAVVTPADTTPSATITWSSGAISSITSGWSLTPPTQVASSSAKVWTSNLLFSDVSPPFSTTSATGSTAIQGTSFSGLVTFTGGDFALDGSTITSIDGDNITTGSISGGSIPDANSPPSGNEEGAHLDLSSGKMVIGDASEYLWYDGVKLTIQGEIVNLTQGRVDGLAGAWQSIQGDIADLSDHAAFGAGAGLYRCIMVGGGGGGGRAYRSVGGGSGGGASGIAFFTLDWNGNTSIAYTHGDSGAQLSGGGASTFSVGGTVRITTNGGGAGGNNNAKTSLSNGGGGGNGVLTSSHSSISSTTFRSGGSGGFGKRNTNNNTSAAAAGGGGVDFFGNGDTNGGNATQNGNSNSGSVAAAGGGGPFGNAPNVSQGNGRRASTGAVNSSSGQLTNSTSSTGFEPQVGSNLLGPYLGSIPQGTSIAYAANHSNSPFYGVGNGLCGGGGVALITNSNNLSGGRAGSGQLFGGGGGGASNRFYSVLGGNGGIGAGGGAGYTGGTGGDGALFVLKL